MKNSVPSISRFIALLVPALLVAQGCGAQTDGGAAVSSISSPGSASENIRLALKFVEFTDGGSPVMTKDHTDQLTTEMNRIYAQCNVSFVDEEYTAVNPADYGLDFNTQSMGELDKIRGQFDNPAKLVVVNTGAWNHGSMGVANAWTNLPGMIPSGAVVEGPVASFAAIVAHEIGHYLSLDHVNDTSDLMNPVVYDNSVTLSGSQCEAVRQSAQNDRVLARR